MDYLLFRLYGPISSWGDVAVGESRHTGTKPTKSALLGLLGASLGLSRDDAAAQQTLADGYKFACCVLSTGQLLRDYHTTQAPDSVGKFRYRTRRDELVLGEDRLGTILSTREYRTDAHAVVAVRSSADAHWSVLELQQALLTPRFHLYLGRKSCPLAAPLQPELITDKNFRQALLNYQPKDVLFDLKEWENQSNWLADDPLPKFYWEGKVEDFADADSVFDPEQVQRLRQYDQPLSRRRWQFQPRQEFFWQTPSTTEPN